MNPKSEKPLRLFNPFSIWTDIALKSGSAMLEAAQAAVSAAKSPKVAVLDEADAATEAAACGEQEAASERQELEEKRIISRAASGPLGRCTNRRGSRRLTQVPDARGGFQFLFGL